jgi:AcrR family transcriptional regulator
LTYDKNKYPICFYGRHMPTFSGTEREHLRAALIEAARQRFVQQGLKKTSLEELTSAVGIAKSSFYSFFESKEALYLELLMLERPEAEARLLPLLDIEGDPAAGIARFLQITMDYIDTTPITQRLITHPEEMKMVARRVTPEHLASKMQYGVLPVAQAVARWQAKGLVIDEDPQVVGGVIRAVTMLLLHKEDIGAEVYPSVIDLTIRLIAAGLAGENNRPDPSIRTNKRSEETV